MGKRLHREIITWKKDNIRKKLYKKKTTQEENYIRREFYKKGRFDKKKTRKKI